MILSHLCTVLGNDRLASAWQGPETSQDDQHEQRDDLQRKTGTDGAAGAANGVGVVSLNTSPDRQSHTDHVQDNGAGHVGVRKDGGRWEQGEEADQGGQHTSSANETSRDLFSSWASYCLVSITLNSIIRGKTILL